MPTRYTAIVMALALSACSQLPQKEMATVKTQAQLQQLQQWAVQGKLALRSKDSAYNLAARWQQDKENFTLQLSGPLGWKALTITKTGGNISVLRSDNVLTYDSIEALEKAIPELADWGAYLLAMPDWLKGLTHSTYPTDNISEGNTKPHFIEQQGWHIEYLRHTQVNGFQLPTKITMARESTRAKIIVNQWQLLATKDE